MDVTGNNRAATGRCKRIRRDSCENHQQYLVNNKKMKLLRSAEHVSMCPVVPSYTNCFKDSVICLNQSGVTKILFGRIDEAEQYFFDVLTVLPNIDASEFAATIERENLCEQGTDGSKQINMEFDEGINPESIPPLAIKLTDDVAMSASIVTYNIGLIYNGRRKFENGLRCFKRSLQLLSSSSHEIHLASTRILHAIGLCNYRLQKYSESVDSYQNALSTIKAITCIDRDEREALYAYTHNALGIVLFRSNTFNNAEGSNPIYFFQESLKFYEKIVRSDTVQTISTVFSNIGQAYYAGGQYDWAVKAFEISFKVRQRVRDPSYSWMNLASVMLHLGKSYQKVGQSDKAAKLFEDFLSLSGTRPRYASIDQDIALAATCLACIYMERGDLQSARQSYEIALPAARSMFGQDSIESASIVNKLSGVCYKLKNLNDSLNYLVEGLEIERVVYGPNHQNVVITLLNIAQIHRDQGDCSKAFLHYEKVRAIQSSNEGPDALCISSTLYSMGLMMYRMKIYSTSFKLYQKALFIQRKHIGDRTNHENIAATLNSIGIVLFHWGKHEMAKSFFEESLSMRQSLYGSYHPDVSVNLFNLATLNLELGHEDAAIALYQETLKVERVIMGQSGVDILKTLQYLGSLYHAKGELDVALSFFKEAVELERVKSGSVHLRVGKILNLIGNIYLQRGSVDLMMDSFIEASRIYTMYNESLAIVGFNLYGISKLHPECAGAA